MDFRSKVLEEPLLEFGDKQTSVDPRYGLTEFGPLQPALGDRVRIGVIGTAETMDGFSSFLERAMAGIPNDSRYVNLNPSFPGLGNRNPFRCSFEVDREGSRVLPNRDIKTVLAVPRHDDAVRSAVDVFIDQARSLLEGSSRPDVIVLALPKQLIEKVVNARSADEDEGDDKDEPAATSLVDFRDLFKARALSLNVPTQIVWPTLWDDHATIGRKFRGTRTVQAPSVRAWNLLNALFYKAGKAPWRLPVKDDEYRTSYLGIGFYRDLDGQRLWTSTAQMFDERGKGIILRGARAHTDRPGNHPYLTREDAYALLRKSADAYRMQHRHYPARVVVLKTSRFETSEVDGFEAALDEVGVDISDMVWVQESTPLALMREGDYPALRGSFVDLGRSAILYSRGSVPYYGTYPGARVPRPLELRPAPGGDTPLAQIAEEILALTKMNWNSTQFDQALPIPIRAARQVGRILKHVSYGDRDQSDYRYYI
ncbi:argonaute/piwi family protein [Aureimonas jatrophae]|uniref:Protein argonaute n=1 Tax=Aureimonas jatrophae TaxID=1166073 RepID=A0A1H0JA89_9HYPH|nr:hypothetical protein [Aureimonas jatrophae]MBB3951520.1 hypothetical protein [Aureimonas jatrophae]SDO40433.1 hypothetical protein SAMN05192530_10675 [Aureimonas jatrophae]